jgi:hypothetical protein
MPLANVNNFDKRVVVTARNVLKISYLVINATLNNY